MSDLSPSPQTPPPNEAAPGASAGCADFVTGQWKVSPMSIVTFDVVILGGGNTGIGVTGPTRRAGLSVAMIESHVLGGTCQISHTGMRGLRLCYLAHADRRLDTGHRPERSRQRGREPARPRTADRQ